VLPKQKLERKLHEAVRLARTRLSQLPDQDADLSVEGEVTSTKTLSSAETIALAVGKSAESSRQPHRTKPSGKGKKREK
jgi:hypothetical protein